jgi:hypothetical protein
MGVYCLDLVTPGTYRLNTMDKTDIVHELNQYATTLEGSTITITPPMWFNVI